jgi:hypothetical protein
MSVTTLRQRPSGRTEQRRQRRADVEEVMAMYFRGVGLDTIAKTLQTSVTKVGKLLEEGLARQPDIDVEWLRAASSVRLDWLAESFAELLADPRGNARTKIDAARKGVRGGTRRVGPIEG